jgi:hypothetical protein
MVLDNTTKSAKIEDCVFWYKTTTNLNKEFRIGSPELWRYLDSRYKRTEEDEEFADTNKSGIVVRKET